jgi:DNA-binding transcriptional LysR family regulator
MVEQRIALGFYASGPVNTDSFHSLYSKRYHVVLVVSVKHPLASRSSVCLEDLQNETVIMTNGRVYSNLVAQWCSRGKISSVMLLNPFETALIHDLCRTGRMVGFHIAPTDMHPDLVGIPIDEFENEYWDIHFIINKSAHLNEAAKEFIAYTGERLFPNNV